MELEKTLSGLVYRGASEVRGPLMVVEGVKNVAFDEVVRVISPSGQEWYGRVLEVGRGKAIVQVFGETEGI